MSYTYSQSYKDACARALAEHVKKFGSTRHKPKPSKNVAESWQRIEAWYVEHADSPNLSPGASEADIARFETAIDAALPEDFKESLRIHNGASWWVPWRYGFLQSLDEILEQWKMYQEWQATGSYADGGEDWDPWQLTGPVKPVFWNPRRIFVTDNSGDHLTLDLDPPPEGTYGQLVDHSHEVGPTKVVATGWGKFLNNLVVDLESGKYVYVNEELEPLKEVERILS